MPRSVKVDLNLGGDAPEGLKNTKEQARGVGEEVEKVNRKLNDTERDALKAAAAMKLLGVESDGVGQKMNFGAGANGMQALDTRIREVRGTIRGLQDDFKNTGNTGGFAALFGAQRDLKGLQDLKKALGGFEKDAEDEGKKSGGLFSGAFSQSIRGILTKPILGPFSAAALAPIVAVLAPPLNAALSVALAGGGIVTGIIGQLRDPEVHQAFVDFGNDFLTTLTSATSSMKQPLLNALGTIKDLVHTILANIDWSSISADLEPLVQGIVKMFDALFPAINNFINSAHFEMLASDLDSLGKAIAIMLDEMARGGKGAAEGLRLIVGVIDIVLISIGGIMLGLSKLIEWGEDFGRIIGVIIGAMGAVTRSFAPLNPIIKGLADGLNAIGNGVIHFFDALSGRDPSSDIKTKWVDPVSQVGAAASLSDDQLSALDASIDKVAVTADTVAAHAVRHLFDQIMNLDQGTLSWHKSLLDLQDALDKNGKAIDKHTGLVSFNTQAGIANRTAVLQAMSANMQLYQAMVASGSGTDAATKAYDDNTAALEGVLRKAHYTDAQIRDLIGSLKDVPHGVNTSIVMQGLTDAINHLSDLLGYINHIDNRNVGFTVHETDVRTQINEPGNFGHTQGRWGTIYTHADVGLLNADVYSARTPARYAFAEPATGGEAFVPRFGDYGRSTAILDQASRWYGGRFMAGGAAMGSRGSVINVALTVNAGMGTDGAAVGQQIASVLIPYVRRNGGNVQAVLGPAI